MKINRSRLIEHIDLMQIHWMTHVYNLSGTHASMSTRKVVKMGNDLFASTWKMMGMSYIPIQT